MSDPANTPALKLRPRNTAQRAATAQSAASAYGATQAQAAPAVSLSSQATTAPSQPPRRGVIAANWPLVTAAAVLLAGGVAMGMAVGSATPSPSTAVASVAPLAQQPQTAKTPQTTAGAPLLPASTVPANVWHRDSTAVQRPALAPPPPPAGATPFEPKPAEKTDPQPRADALPAEPAKTEPAENAASEPAMTNAPVQMAAAPVPPKSLPMPFAGSQAWRARAVPPPAGAKPPFVAILIDDAGLDRKETERAIALPGPITLSFMTYANDLAAQSRAARSAGHELMLHLPMEPLDMKHNDPGPHALLMKLDAAEIERRLDWGLGRFEGYVGVNNHMGSRFTRDAERMTEVMTALRKRQVFWLDSLSGPGSVGVKEARKAGLDAVERDLFLDDGRSPGVAYELAAMERIAKARGDVIAIGHPHATTLAALEKWTTTAKERGFSLVPVSTVLLRREQMER